MPTWSDQIKEINHETRAIAKASKLEVAKKGEKPTNNNTDKLVCMSQATTSDICVRSDPRCYYGAYAKRHIRVHSSDWRAQIQCVCIVFNLVSFLNYNYYFSLSNKWGMTRWHMLAVGRTTTLLWDHPSIATAWIMNTMRRTTIYVTLDEAIANALRHHGRWAACTWVASVAHVATVCKSMCRASGY